MATKSANVTARVEPEVKYEAEKIISELGLSVSSVINSLCKQIILKKGIPYPLTVKKGPITVAEMSKSEFDSMIKKGFKLAKNGESIPIEEVFNDLLKEI